MTFANHSTTTSPVTLTVLGTTGNNEDSDFTQEEIDEASAALDEIICRMIGATEDFLWVRQVDLHNTEPRKHDEDDDVVIYGHDFATLYDDFLNVYCKFCDATQNGSKEAYYQLIDDMIEAVEHFLSVRKVDLRNKEKRADSEQDDVIYGTDYTELYSEFYDVTSTELLGY